jgi:uncharacterized membrane protein
MYNKYKVVINLCFLFSKKKGEKLFNLFLKNKKIIYFPHLLFNILSFCYCVKIELVSPNPELLLWVEVLFYKYLLELFEEVF